MSEPDGGESKGKGPSQATKLAQLAAELVDVVAGADGRAYAVSKKGPGAHIAFPLKGQKGLRTRLARSYSEVHGAVPSQSALTDVTAVLEGQAMDLDPRPIGLRLASHEGQVVLDLGDAAGRCAIIGPDGWRVSHTSPVLFRRTALTSPLPAPGEPGNTQAGIAALRRLLNVDEPGFRLLVGWLVSGLVPDMPHPILAARGEQGTGKSTALSMLVNLVDPSPAPLRSLPKDQKTWSVTASASWAVCLDNVSTIPPWLSDTLCKAVTGEGFLDRALYSDDDVSVVSYRRLIAMTSIDTGALASDLNERVLPVEFVPIKADQRRTDAEVRATFDFEAPQILAALLDLLSAVLAQLPATELTELPRMADFARVLAALDVVTGWDTLATYRAATEVSTADLIDAKPFTAAVADFVEKQGEWTGTMGQLLACIDTPDPRPKSWPVDPTRAGSQLKRDAPVLRSVGVTVEDAGRSRDRSRSRLYRLALEPEESPPGQCPQPEEVSDAVVTSHDGSFFAHEVTSDPTDATDAVSAPVPTRNTSAHPVSDAVGAADTSAAPLSTDDRSPLEEGTCGWCGNHFTRYTTTGHPNRCTPCARNGGTPPPT
ncbi:ATP-binding protein [Halostreptopolyspora alba]|uniref:ATP-binding protein n=1 Tax=Halostreptopolyspora alba TaxID=2487137 RepID=A0A3N0E754_9ACTN|nr:ATP-binding protein [Nocardiopsaceae bacterium YIM 96095]